jgi:dihydroflavonol-4-reductase
MNVLVTGAAGFMGSHLVASQLAQGHSVRAFDLNRHGLERLGQSDRLDLCAGDIADSAAVRAAVESIDIVYHLAAEHLDVSLPDRYYWQVNVDGTRQLVQAAAEAGVRRLVHCSSVGVYGEVRQPPADEATPCRPTNVYERTKLAGEQAALQVAGETHLPVVIARPAWVYGPRCPRTARLFRTIQKGRFFIFGSGRTLRHPLYVADAVRGLELCAAAHGAEGQVYILAGECPVSIEHLAQSIAAVLGVRPPRLHLPIALGLTAAYALQLAYQPLGKAPPFSRRSLDFFLKDNAYAIGKATRGLDFRPRADLRSGLDETRIWLDSQGRHHGHHKGRLQNDSSSLHL